LLSNYVQEWFGSWYLVNREAALVAVNVTVEGKVDLVPLPQVFQIGAAIGLSEGAPNLLVVRRGGVPHHTVHEENQPRLLAPVGAGKAVLQKLVLLRADGPVNLRVSNTELKRPPICRVPRDHVGHLLH
jgi:hypothetical protein